MKKKIEIHTRRSIAALMEEFGKFALSIDSPLPLIKWAMEAIPEVIDCELMHLGLIRIDSVLSNVCGAGSAAHLADAFSAKVKGAYKKVPELKDLVWEDSDFSVVMPAKIKAGKSIGSFHFYQLKVLNNVVGSVALGSSKKEAFPKYQMNLFENLCDQLALGLNSLLDKDIIKQQSEQIVEEKKTFEAIACGMSEGLVLLDKSSNPLAVNDAAKTLLCFEGEKDERAVSKFIAEQFVTPASRKKPQKRDVLLTKPHKQVIQMSTTPIFDKRGEYHGMSVILTDVTREREVDQMKSDFVSAVSHELRTPLASIREAVALVYDGVSGAINDKQKRCLEIAIRNSDRLGRLIGDLLNLSRIEAGKVTMKRSAVDVRQIAEHVVATLKPVAEKAGVKLLMAIKKDVPQLFADPDQLTQVLINLVGNSLKFTPEGGSITIDASMPSGTNNVSISAKDTGPGISKEDQGRLFQKFSQLDTGLTRKPGGTGLGLAISKEIVTKHGGRIWVESDPGKGARFVFTIPVFKIDLIYLDIIQQEIDRVKTAKGNLSVLLVRSPKGDSASLETACRELVSSGDVVIKYQDKHVVILTDSDIQGVKALTKRIKDGIGQFVDVRVAGYPQDGMTAEEIMEKLIS